MRFDQQPLRNRYILVRAGETASDAKGVIKVKDLPTMPDLMLKLSVSLNLAGSLGIAKAVKAAKGNPRQVAVAISKIEELPKTDCALVPFPG